MIYTPLTKKAMRLSYEKHREQTDKCGMPYVLHPLHVAESMTDEYSTCVALLHDIIEDTDVTPQRLADEGFPPQVVEAVVLLTHSDSTPYLDYVREIKHNRLARLVKIADLTHNSDLTRLDTVTEKDLERVQKYKAALDILTHNNGADVLTVNIRYTGKGSSAREFAKEMVESGIVEDIRREDGNLRYEYYYPTEDPETVLLIDCWKDQASLDAHHKSEMMGKISALREKYQLKMTVERFVSERKQSK